MKQRRHTCIVCGRKRYEQYMTRTDVLNAWKHWACNMKNDKAGLMALLKNETCSDKLSDLNGQLLRLHDKELFKRLFVSRSII